MNPTGLPVGGIVLAGGHSRRMGTSKAWLMLGGESMLRRVVRIVADVVTPVVVAARPDQPLPPLPQDVRTVHDTIDDVGPLAGLAAGFEALAGECQAAFVISCDQPLIKPEVIRRLVEQLGENRAIIVAHEGRPHPLTAVYRLDTRDLLLQQLAQGDRSVSAVSQRCAAHVVTGDALHDVDPTLDSLRNINDPDEYDRVVRSQGD